MSETAAPTTSATNPPQPPADQRKYKEFLDLLPLTLALAGLPTSEGRLYSEEQIEGRAMTIRIAYRKAREATRECLGG